MYMENGGKTDTRGQNGHSGFFYYKKINSIQFLMRINK